MKRKLDDISMAFIVSRGRSGSTLIQSILDAHPNICAPIEAKFVLHLATRYRKTTNWSSKVIARFIDDLYTNRKFRLFWEVSKDELTTLFDRYEIASFSDACKVVYLSHHSMFDKKAICLIVDKNPLYSIFIPPILAVFPEAKFVHLIRDARAATYSHLASLRQKNIPQLAQEWRILNKAIEGQKEIGLDCYTLHYENLVHSPTVEFEQLFKFLDIPFTSDLLEAHKTIKEKISNNKYLALKHHQGIGQAINMDQVNSWKTELSERNIELINSICRELLMEYNYPIETKATGSSLLIHFGAFRAKLKNWLLRRMFCLPFVLRSGIYNLASLILDKKFK